MSVFTKADYLNAAAKILDGVPTHGPDGKRREPMSKLRFNELQFGPDPQTLTPEEMQAGWRWCSEFDDLLTDACPMPPGECLCAHHPRPSLADEGEKV